MQIIVRSLVVVLALTGAAATNLSFASSAVAQASVTKTSAMPTPSCPPDDPNACGIAGN